MGMNNPYQTYQRQAVTTSKPEELTLMLYQGMVKFIRLAKLAMEKQTIEEAHHNNLKAQDILSELMITLKDGYPISDSLLALYDYMKRRLVEANRTKRVEILEEVEGFAVDLADTWSTAIKEMKTKG
ncbi:flagellar export chaperone FliS [Pullulanibacillus sp. KACC 23026]|uniref:flagellar export chaperone FliS n=1 Tax=Pullulanibacillus sp. KACC 23026 TaxID=3028315 RepID=UPI0023AFC3C9|nr:flagellar export chaperone FliS [Pullulanibacillus sp. KACC 23026]WEG11243.1 flagellar export chaperone FliS [Pullulanibacillus sp. KACC 23026]